MSPGIASARRPSARCPIGDGLDLVLTAGGHDDVAARFGETDRDPLTDAASGTRDDGDLIRQRESIENAHHGTATMVTVPVDPSISIVAPSGIRRVAATTDTAHGRPSSRHMIAA